MNKGNNDYSIKKLYAEQKHQIQIFVYENGVEKTKKIPLCDVRMVVDDEVVDVAWLVREAREQKKINQAVLDEVRLLKEENAKMKETIETTIRNLITGGL